MESAGVTWSPEEFARRYDSSVLVRRWGATVIDMLLFLGLLLAPLALPESAQLPAYLLFAAIMLAYYPILERRFGRTPGKAVCRLRVVDVAGGRPSWGSVFARTALRLVEVNPFLLGGIPAGIVVLASKKRQRLGDMAANTFVLREEDARYLDSLRSGAYGDGVPPVPPPGLAAISPSGGVERWLVPTNRSGWCIAAGYLGLFAVLLVPAPLALGAGILGLREVARDPSLGGRGRAWFGIVAGALFTLVLAAVVVVSILDRR
jgi:uncharacterized RDD family membrane protein YckC